LKFLSYTKESSALKLISGLEIEFFSKVEEAGCILPAQLPDYCSKEYISEMLNFIMFYNSHKQQYSITISTKKILNGT
jgi:hypothetical protein